VIKWARAQVTRKCGADWCVPEKNTPKEIAAIFNGMRQDVRYTSDVAGVDTYATPGRTLQHRAGDCDDYATLGASALQALGIPARFKVIRTRDSQTWNHVYLQASATKSGQGPWISLDASVPVRAGWEVPRGQIAESRVFEVALDGYALR
jgi:transglutaminase-like putative cysteine protease